MGCNIPRRLSLTNLCLVEVYVESQHGLQQIITGFTETVISANNEAVMDNITTVISVAPMRAGETLAFLSAGTKKPALAATQTARQAKTK